jgi:hypothetical protein
MRGKGYDYLTNQTLDWASESVKGAGLRLLSARYFRARSDVETKRFFKSGGSKWSYTKLMKSAVPDIDLSGESGGDTLKTSKFTFFTPSFVFASPGIPVGNMVGTTPTYSPPPVGKAGKAGVATGTSLQKAAVGANSYVTNALGANKFLSQKLMAPVSMMSLNLQTKLGTVPASTKKTLDDVAADLLVSQSDPDFSLYPKNVKAYEVPNQKGSKISDEEQRQKAKYAAVLAGKGCVVVSAKAEFDEPPLMTSSHPQGYDIENNKLKPQTLEFFIGPILANLTKIKYTSHINPLWLGGSPHTILPKFYGPGLANLKSAGILSALAIATSGIKPAFKTFKTPTGFGSVHVGNLNLLNFSDTTTPTILDSVNPTNKVTVLKNLPNQLKSLVLGSQSGLALKDVFAPTDFSATSEDSEATKIAPIFAIQNLNIVFQLYKNIVQIEYLEGFGWPTLQITNSLGQLEKVSGARPLLRAPQWRTLNENILNDLEDKATSRTTLLCRLVRYINKDLGIGHSTKLDMPTIDKHFIMTIDPDIEEEISYEILMKKWIFPALYSQASTGETQVDSGKMDDLSKGTWKLGPPTVEDEITVRRFEGTVLIGATCNASHPSDGG